MKRLNDLRWKLHLRDLRRFNRRHGIGVPEDQLPQAPGNVEIVEGEWWVRTNA